MSEMTEAGLAPTDDFVPPSNPWRQVEPVALGAGSILALLLVWELLPELVSAPYVSDVLRVELLDDEPLCWNMPFSVAASSLRSSPVS